MVRQAITRAVTWQRNSITWPNQTCNPIEQMTHHPNNSFTAEAITMLANKALLMLEAMDFLNSHQGMAYQVKVLRKWCNLGGRMLAQGDKESDLLGTTRRCSSNNRNRARVMGREVA